MNAAQAHGHWYRRIKLILVPGGEVAFDASDRAVRIVSRADPFVPVGSPFHPRMVGPSPLNARDERVHVTMRALWQDHVTWTRVFLMTTIAGLPDADMATQRLLRNQEDLGNAIRPFYGDAAAEQMTQLLRTHITGAAEVVAAASAGDTARLNTAITAWYANADDIAGFLAGANPRWTAADLRTMMYAHLEKTTSEAVARLHHDWAGDIVAYDAIVTQSGEMSDMLSTGITAQFPATQPPTQ